MPHCATSANEFESSVSVTAKTIDGEIIIEARDSCDTQPLHDGEACTVDERKVLIRESFADGPCRFEVRRCHFLNRGRAAPYATPELFGRISVDSAIQQKPRLDQNVIRDV